MQVNRTTVVIGALAALCLGAAGCGPEGGSGDTGAGGTGATTSGEMHAPGGATGSGAGSSGTAATGTPVEGARPGWSGEQAKPPVGKNPVVVLETSMGVIKIQLDSEKAPISTKNFVEYVNSGHYNGTIFHRVMADFMIQGGGFTSDLKEKPARDPIKNEAGNGLSNMRGTVAMARTPDPDSATAQFFINVVDNDRLDHRDDTRQGFGYAVFGKVIQGMDVVDKIRAVATGDKNSPDGGPMENVPLKPVTIKSAKLQKMAAGDGHRLALRALPTPCGHPTFGSKVRNTL